MQLLSLAFSIFLPEIRARCAQSVPDFQIGGRSPLRVTTRVGNPISRKESPRFCAPSNITCTCHLLSIFCAASQVVFATCRSGQQKNHVNRALSSCRGACRSVPHVPCEPNAIKLSRCAVYQHRYCEMRAVLQLHKLPFLGGEVL